MFETGQVFQMIRRASGSVGIVAALGLATAVPPSSASDTLVGRAVLPAATFAEGPTSGQQLGAEPINGQSVPFINKQPVQGFSAIRDNGDGTFWLMSDNGYGVIENSADFNLRVYRIRPLFTICSRNRHLFLTFEEEKEQNFYTEVLYEASSSKRQR